MLKIWSHCFMMNIRPPGKSTYIQTYTYIHTTKWAARRLYILGFSALFLAACYFLLALIIYQQILEAAAMSRGGSYGGGQSSLGYLFGSDEKPSAAPPPRTVNPPPYGVDTVTDQKPPDGRSPTEKEKVSNNYHRAQGQNSGNFITVSITCFHVYQVLAIYDGNALFAPYLTYIQFFHMLHIYNICNNTSGSSINKSQIRTRWRFVSRLLVWR